MDHTEQPTPEEIRHDLLSLALRHLRAAESAVSTGYIAAARWHLLNYHAISESC